MFMGFFGVFWFLHFIFLLRLYFLSLFLVKQMYSRLDTMKYKNDHDSY